jgi:Xaa-Pro aminopeptidase
MSVIFPIDDEMTTITSGGPPQPPTPPEWAVRGVKNRISVPFFPNILSVSTLDAQAAVKALNARNDKRLGIVRPASMSAAYYNCLKENLPSVEFVDVTDMIDQIKAVKSEAELEKIILAAKTQDAVVAAMPTIIRPGKYEYEVRTEICRILGDFGSEEQLIMLSSAPPGKPAGHIQHFFQNRRIEPGDQVMVMIEPNGPGGYFAEIGRTWVLGEPHPELLSVWKDSVAAQAFAADLCKPGAAPRDIIKKYNYEFLANLGYPPDLRLFAHGQGYDLVERPAIIDSEEMLIAENMALAIHPTLSKNGAYAFCCDNFIVSKEGTKRIHKSPQEIFVIDC